MAEIGGGYVGSTCPHGVDYSGFPASSCEFLEHFEFLVLSPTVGHTPMFSK